MDDLECGNITDQEFMLALQNRCRPGTSIEHVRDAWNAVLLEPRPEVVPLLKKLASRFDLLLFSNTNALHAEFFERQILADHGKAFGQAFRQIIYSHRLGLRKPNRRPIERSSANSELPLRPPCSSMIPRSMSSAPHRPAGRQPTTIRTTCP